ncbi:MAG: hypothetical protein ACRERC_14645 [Candidatus Binatia bacterium]
MSSLVTALLVAVGLSAQAPAADLGRGEPLCPAPVSTCKSDDAASCPAGYRCACVPSCPACRDCDAQVCVPELSRQCRTACDCPPGLGCEAERCVAGTAPVFCCESERCPLGQPCQHGDGRADRCGQQCRTACDCEPGVGCFDGQCIAGFAPVYCCDGAECPADQQCQHRDGRHDRCGQACLNQVWRCDTAGGSCGADRTCSCSASCPTCEDCGPGVCVPPGTATPYRCTAEGGCSQPGDRCACVSSCPECDDCAFSVCIPACDPMCERRQRISSKRIDRVVALTAQCRTDADCVRVDTSSACRATCGAWVSRRYADRVGRLIDYLDQRYCTTYRSDNCPFTTPRCINERAACVDHVCTGVSP